MKTEGYHLVDSANTPFFWLADTAWNLWCRGTPGEWSAYIARRREQGFNAIQFVAGWWRGCHDPIHGRSYDVIDGEVVFNEPAMAKLDLLMAKIRDAGMVAAPVMLWTLTEDDPGRVYDEDQCVRIARTLFERFDASDVVWLLGGDGDYTTPEARERWKRVGREVFSSSPEATATLHPCGATWVGDAFAREPWYDIVGIQSGHGAGEEDIRFLVGSDYATAWKRIRKPFINLEPNYEKAIAYGTERRYDAYHVRRASYWSLTVAPPAGITYGTNSVWMWAKAEGEVAEGHGGIWSGRPWHKDIDTPGADSMRILREFFEKLPWERLRPAPERLKYQPGDDDIYRWQTVAATPEGDCLVAYSPECDALHLDTRGLAAGLRTYEVNPETGRWLEVTGAHCNRPETEYSLRNVQSRDGLLVFCGPGGASAG